MAAHLTRGGDSRRPPVFVLGLGPNGYGHARSLVRAGVPVVGFHYSDQHFGRASRLIPSHPMERQQSPEALARLLIDRAAPFADKPVLVAASDEFAFLLAQARDRLAESFLFHWLSSETASIVFDKSRMVHLCQQAGLLCPRTHLTDIGECIAATARRFCFPCIVKPIRSFRTAFPRDQKNYVAASARDLIEFYRRRPDLLGATFWQEVIAGPDDDIYQCNVLCAQSGTVSALSGVRKLRQYPRGYGNMCFGRTETNATVASKSLALLQLLEYRGFASIEFKRHARENQYYFIELNPRLPRYCGLFADAGLNLPYLGYADLSATDTCAAPNHQREHVYWVIAGEDRESFLADRRPHPHRLVRWLLSIAKARSFAWWTMRDPGPFVRAIARRPRRTRPINPSATSAPALGVMRQVFERQYANPRHVDVGPDSFFIYDLKPPHLTSNVPILFCPGWMENPLNHKETIYALYRQGRRTVFPDAPHGIHARPRMNLPMAQLRHAAALTATLTHQGIHHVEAIAHSAGAIALAVAATADDGPRFRNVVLQNPAGLCGRQRTVTVAWHALQELRRETRRQRCRPTEHRLIRDPQRRRMYWHATLAKTLAEVDAIAQADIRELLRHMRRNGTGVAVVHGTDDRLFSMERMQQHVDAGVLDGFYSVEGGHQQILVEPSRYASLAHAALLALERKRRAATLLQDATA